MSSPFSTIEEFNSAIDGPTEGAIYTFANAPVFNMIALLVAVGLFVWFIASAYTHAKPPAVDRSLERLSSFIVIGLLSLVAADYPRSVRSEKATQAAVPTMMGASRRAAPMGLLGMVGIVGLPGLRRSKARPSRKATGSAEGKLGRRRKKRSSRRSYLR